MNASGKLLPVGWMIDCKGEPLPDPNRASPNRAGEGYLLSTGGHKGFHTAQCAATLSQ